MNLTLHYPPSSDDPAPSGGLQGAAVVPLASTNLGPEDVNFPDKVLLLREDLSSTLADTRSNLSRIIMDMASFMGQEAICIWVRTKKKWAEDFLLGVSALNFFPTTTRVMP